MEANITQLPWAFTTRLGNSGYTRQINWDYVIYSSAFPNNEVCQLFRDGTEFNDLGEANAAFIVKCVNEHDTLLRQRDAFREALEDIARGPLQGPQPFGEYAIQVAKANLAKGETPCS